MRLVDGNSIDVTSDEWLDSIEKFGIYNGDMIFVSAKNGSRYYFRPVNDAQAILFHTILSDMMTHGTVSDGGNDE